jgi:hypothetical protein
MEGVLMVSIGNNDPVSSISNVEKGLKGLNSQVDKLVEGLKKVTGLAGTTFGNVKQVLGMNMGQGPGMNLGTSNATFSSTTGGAQNVMPWAYSKTGAATIGGIQLGLGIAGGAYAALPDLGMTVSRASGFYGAATRAPGMTRAGLAAATFGALRGGITGMGEDAAAAAMLAQGYNIMPGTASFTQAMGEVGGAARGFNMPNATAAAAIGGLHTGAMGGGLYQLGISTINPKTGEIRSTEDIARQLYNRFTGNRKGITAGDVAYSARAGFLGAELTNLGFDSSQKEIMIRAFTAFSQGQGFDLANMSGADNPMSGVYQMNTSATSLMERGTEAQLRGLGGAADLITKLNKSLEGLPDKFFELKGALQAFSSSGPGAGVGAVLGGVGAVVSGIAIGAGARSALAKATAAMAAKGAGEVVAKGAGEVVAKTAAQTAVQTAGGVAVRGGAMALGRAVPIVGGVVGAASGQGFLSTVGIGAAAGGIAGSFAGGVGAVPGAIAGGVLTGLGYLGTKAVKAMTSTKNAPVISGNATETQFATDVLYRLNAPITDSNIAAMTTWMKFEGGGGGKATGLGVNSAMFNPLNTTLKTSGSTGSMNSHDVQRYASYDAGLSATVQTLKLGHYTSIVAALKQGTSTSDVLSAVNASPWGTKIPGYSVNNTGSNSSMGSGQTVNINLTIDKASDAEAIAFAKRVKEILLKDRALNTVGSR